MRFDPISSSLFLGIRRLWTALAVRSLEFSRRRAHHAAKGARKVALAIEANGKADIHEAGPGYAQHRLGMFQAAFQHVPVGRHAYGSLEHSRKVVQAQPRNFCELAQRQLLAQVGFDVIQYTPRLVTRQAARLWNCAYRRGRGMTLP